MKMATKQKHIHWQRTMKRVLLCIKLIVKSSIQVRYDYFEYDFLKNMDSQETYFGENGCSEKLSVYVLGIGYDMRFDDH